MNKRKISGIAVVALVALALVVTVTAVVWAESETATMEQAPALTGNLRAPEETGQPRITEEPFTAILEQGLEDPVTPASCTSLSTHTSSFAACESWCYNQFCGITGWNPSTCICQCGYML